MFEIWLPVLFRLVRLDCEHLESPRRLDSRDSLCSSSFAVLTPAVLASSRFGETPAPFNPTRVGWSVSCSRAGLKGATRWRKAGDASTVANVVSEERSEPPDASESGLSR